MPPYGSTKCKETNNLQPNIPESRKGAFLI